MSSQSREESTSPWEGSSLMGGFEFLEEDRESRLTAVVRGRVPVSAATRIRSGAEWSAPPPFEALRIAVWIS